MLGEPRVIRFSPHCAMLRQLCQSRQSWWSPRSLILRLLVASTAQAPATKIDPLNSCLANIAYTARLRAKHSHRNPLQSFRDRERPSGQPNRLPLIVAARGESVDLEHQHAGSHSRITLRPSTWRREYDR